MQEYLVKNYGRDENNPEFHVVNNEAPKDHPDSLWYWLNLQHRDEALIKIYPIGECLVDFT